MPSYDPAMAAGANQQELDFELAVDAYRDGELEVATRLMCQILEGGTSNPAHMSLGGFLIATVKQDVRRGLALCETAVSQGSYDPVVFLNLSRLHLATGVKKLAVETLRRGLRVHPQDESLLAEINRLNPRRNPVVPKLERRHPANRVLGQIAEKLNK